MNRTQKWLTFLGLVASGLGLPLLGFTTAESLLGKREEILEDKIGDLEGEIRKKEAEIAELHELFRKNRKPVEISPLRRAEGRQETPVPQVEDPVPPSPAPVDAYDVYLSSGNSAPLFDGALTLSVTSTQFAVSPAGYRASFVLRAPGSPEKQVLRAVDAYSIEYAGFHVVLDRVEPTGAGFSVTRPAS